MAWALFSNDNHDMRVHATAYGFVKSSLFPFKTAAWPLAAQY